MEREGRIGVGGRRGSASIMNVSSFGREMICVREEAVVVSFSPVVKFSFSSF